MVEDDDEDDDDDDYNLVVLFQVDSILYKDENKESRDILDECLQNSDWLTKV